MWRILWMDDEHNVNAGEWMDNFDLLAAWVRYVNRFYRLPHCIQAYPKI